MMTIHKEGYSLITKFFIGLGAIDVLVYLLAGEGMLFYFALFATTVFFLLVVSFFRNPNRKPVIGDDLVIAPANGKVVVIEETYEGEYLKENRIQISIFMSPLNVHINWYPIRGIIKYYRYHKGLFLKAWLPKSSTDNERTTVVIENENKVQILMRQIAGAVARRIVSYAEEGKAVDQCEEEGFIKFGSRVDTFVPLDAKIEVEIGQKVTGSQTILARLK